MHARPQACDMRGANEAFLLGLFARTQEMRFRRRTSIDFQSASALAPPVRESATGLRVYVSRNGER
jgi:hypothetical protein